jgi:AcrR family transcriptional regulator
MSDRPYHHGNLRAALIQAGVEQARSGGPAALSVRDLARVTHVSPSAAYRHFPDLDHLLAEVSRCARQELAAAMLQARTAVAGAGPEAELARFQAIGEAYIRFAVGHPHLFDTAFMSCLAKPLEVDEPSAWAVLESSLDALVQAGLLAPPRRLRAPLVAWSFVHGAASILVRQALPVEVDFATVLATMAESVMGALGIGSHI